LQATDPSRQKKLGRTIKGFDQNIWEKNREKIVYDANLAKFTQNPGKAYFIDNNNNCCSGLKEQLLATADKMLVEASPLDKVWGVGLAPNDPRVYDPAQWKGKNLLGNALMKVRDSILKEELAMDTNNLNFH